MWTGQRRATRGFLLVSAAARTVHGRHRRLAWLAAAPVQIVSSTARESRSGSRTPSSLAIASLEQAISTTEQRLTALASASNRYERWTPQSF
jgi:hypothetical protein